MLEEARLRKQKARTETSIALWPVQERYKEELANVVHTRRVLPLLYDKGFQLIVVEDYDHKLAGAIVEVHFTLGLNSGAQDASNLGWKLVLVKKGLAHMSLLETYDAERLPVISEAQNDYINPKSCNDGSKHARPASPHPFHARLSLSLQQHRP
ncbi:uncharacterized protein EDB91DRAFT_1246947 [Suillus paluster]|uniref:uncharacterized protein n=1 Tax=Suillus paluster TaxID=48578 RepID=UPI001B861432|nr:uncharacterized protein EDB91DRAFT_1246947 [Suillus paluster]KAG1744072.1 hypothetical protein EDB91DRAFT_1246947 [Suillus paluster]